MVFIIKCESVSKDVEDFLQNRNLKDVHIDWFSKSTRVYPKVSRLAAWSENCK
jgi:hypothetical protein